MSPPMHHNEPSSIWTDPGRGGYPDYFLTSSIGPSHLENLESTKPLAPAGTSVPCSPPGIPQSFGPSVAAAAPPCSCDSDDMLAANSFMSFVSQGSASTPPISGLLLPMPGDAFGHTYASLVPPQQPQNGEQRQNSTSSFLSSFTHHGQTITMSDEEDDKFMSGVDGDEDENDEGDIGMTGERN